MKSKLLMNSKSFDGKLSKDEDNIELTFSASIDISGNATICINRFPLNLSTKFIYENFNKMGTHFEKFSLIGISQDGVKFECTDLIITSLDQNTSEAGTTICPVIHYSFAKITIPREKETPPVLSWRIKGFECFHTLTAETNIGTVEMAGSKDADGKNEVSGHIKITSSNVPTDLEVWRESATQLCDHLQHVMSFASNVNLESPIIEFSSRDKIEVEIYSSAKQQKSIWPPFSKLHMQDIFQCAVQNYFHKIFEVNNLFFAIQWFNMQGAYREAKLISSMTVLENLIDSNLAEQDSFLFGEKTYETLRKKTKLHRKKRS